VYFIRIKFFIYVFAVGPWLVLTNHSFAQQNNQVIDSLTLILEDAKGPDRFNTLFELFRLNLGISLPEAERYALEALEVSTSLNDTLAMVKSNNALGHIKREMGLPRNAIPYFEVALKLAKASGFRDQVMYILNNLGLANQRSANFAKALEYHLESNNIGLLYQDMGDYENAFTYYKKNYDLKVQTKEYYDFELCLISLAEVSNTLKMYKDARGYLKEVFDRCSSEVNCSKRQLALAHNGMGYALLNSSDFDNAEKEFSIAANLFTEIQSPDKVDAYNGWALVRFRMGDNKGAIEKLSIAQPMAEDLEIPKYLLRIYQTYSDIYTQQKDFKKATEYQRKFISLNQEIFNADLIKNIARVQAEYQEEENLRTIAAQDQEILSREESLSLQRKQFLFLVIIATLVFILAMVFYRNQKRQARSNLELEKAKEIIVQKNKELVANNTELDNRVQERTKELHSSNESLKKVNEELDNFIYKTSHDIRGPLTSLKGITHLAIRESKEDMVSSYLQKLDVTADKLNKILTRLQIINQINHALLLPELIDFNTMIEEILAMERKRGIPANLKISTSVAEGIILFSDKTVLTIVLENLIDNAIKFYNSSDRKNPFVNISILNSENEITIKVVDNGIGIRSVAPGQIFKMFVRASERSESGGIGLYLTKISAEKLGGTIEMNITPEEYTEFTVKLPSDLRTVIKHREETDRKMELEKMRLAQLQYEEAKSTQSKSS
jgi:signal transduction histidine kinase